ncbi:hypothetical protein HOT32_gp59 [Erwinia phage Faunus]|uniref:Uncharacterized protein n=1 Tax=Erwinia phage Faunus TaxID=2182346 RepID=A0A2U8UWK3_9CAUD|nr:hypothetical protein HOT32_gp59 [Erwinia phage Faunus]AWN08642.1 hypothetical protein [Erwinia phage Faunus]
MRTIYPVRINNSSLVVVDKQVSLLTNTLLAGYDMLSNKDFSGRGNDFEYGGGFSAQGAALADDAAHIIKTNVMEQEEMTVIGCWNLGQSSVAASFINNFNGTGPEYTGTRIVKQANDQGLMNIAAGGFGLEQLAFTFTGAWTTRAFRWNSSVLDVVYHSGLKNTKNLSGRLIGNNPFVLNGVPEGVNGGGIVNGFSGTLGFLLFYNELTPDSVCVERMNTLASIMSDRGVLIP